jgi:hypothetical protein
MIERNAKVMNPDLLTVTIARDTFEKGDVIQIIDEQHPWFPCLLIVDEVKSWGVRACVMIPAANDGTKPPSRAYTRLRFEQIEKIGEAAFVLQ